MTETSDFPGEFYAIDVGMHDGADSIYYARRGFKVIAFEANPALVADGRAKFADLNLDIDVRHFAVTSNAAPTARFFVNKHRSQWSSLDAALGERWSDTVEIDVPTCNLADHLAPLGNRVHLVKIDIEGADLVAVQQLAALEHKPAYLSVENGGSRFVQAMVAMGYHKFKFSNQRIHHLVRVPKDSRHGHWVDQVFLPHSSGPFGEDLVGRWLTADEAERIGDALAAAREKAPDNLFADAIGWFDMHAAR